MSAQGTPASAPHGDTPAFETLPANTPSGDAGRGLFVVFEGGDGTGKSTQQRLLADALQQAGVEVVVTHEPGDSWLGQQVRRLVLSPDSGDISPRAEALLYAADKAQHIAEVVEPAMRRGAVVVCDRYVDSMLAYQGAGRVLDVDEVERVARWATGDLRPDLTVLLDLEPQAGVGAIEVKDRIEQAGAEMHQRVRDGFLALAARDPERYAVIPARSGTPAEVARQVLDAVLRLPFGWPDPLRAQRIAGSGPGDLAGGAPELSDPAGRL